MNKKYPGLIICGTDTDVGKTIVSALIIQGLNAKYWKPVQSGLEDGSDTNQICKLLKLPPNRVFGEAYKFQAPVSPHWAAELEQTTIDPLKLTIPSLEDTLIIETAGGVLVPLTNNLLQIDQIKAWKLPVVLVARAGLGTINHTLLTLEALRSREIPILGIILNGPLHPNNPKTIKELGQIQIIGELPLLDKVSAKELDNQWKIQKMGSKFNKLLIA